MIRYRISGHTLDKIEAVECTRESETNVWRKTPMGGERMDRKVTKFHRYFDTWQQAHHFQIHRATSRLRGARREFKRAEANLEQVLMMKDPNA